MFFNVYVGGVLSYLSQIVSENLMNLKWHAILLSFMIISLDHLNETTILEYILYWMPKMFDLINYISQ